MSLHSFTWLILSLFLCPCPSKLSSQKHWIPLLLLNNLKCKMFHMQLLLANLCIWSLVFGHILHMQLVIVFNLWPIVVHCIGLLSNASFIIWNIPILKAFPTLHMPSKNSFKVGQMLIGLMTLNFINQPLGVFFYFGVGGEYHGKIGKSHNCSLCIYRIWICICCFSYKRNCVAFINYSMIYGYCN
jgi:hypothetical protein